MEVCVCVILCYMCVCVSVDVCFSATVCLHMHATSVLAVAAATETCQNTVHTQAHISTIHHRNVIDGEVPEISVKRERTAHRYESARIL